jgi:hypothetical protein
MIRRLAGARVFTDYYDEAWHTSLYRLVLIALMAGSFAAGPLVLRWGIVGSWSGYVLPLAALSGMLGAMTTGLLGRPSWRDRRGAMFRLGEIALLLVLTRVLVWVFSDGLPTLADLQEWVLAPGSFFSGEYLFAAVTLLMSWWLSFEAAADFRALAIQPDEAAARASETWGDSKSQWRVGRSQPRIDILQGFAVRWIALGVVLIICAGLTRVDVGVTAGGIVRVGLRGLGLRGEVVVALALYFLTGLLLLSHGRLAVLRGRWYNQEVEIAPSLVHRWHTSSVLFVLLIALVALLMPLGTTGWLAEALEWLIALIARILMAIALFFTLLFALLMRLLEAIFGAPAEMPVETPTPEPMPQPIPTQAEMADQLPPWLGGAVLWLVLGAVTLFLLVNFARASGLLEGQLGGKLMRWRLWWRARRARMEASLTDGMRRVTAPFRRAVPPRGRPSFRSGRGEEPRLPREQVRRYYLAAVKEAEEEGARRRAGQTPSEFAGELAANWPESDQDIESLTEAFVDARYSTREIDELEAASARSAWRRLTRALRRPKRDGEGSR